MKKSATFILFPFLCLLPPLAGAQAAGVNKLLLFTLNDDQVAGYVATPGPGWSNWVDVGAASPASAARQEFYAIFRQPSNPWSSSPRVTPPAPAALTRIGPKGGILSKELLPAAIQVVQSECTLPPGGNICPDVFATATTVKSLPGKLVVYASKDLYSGGYFQRSSWTYIFDPAAPMGSADRWTLLPDGSCYYAACAGNAVDTLFYVFPRAGSATAVYQYIAK